jgi:hypothetical protein
MKTVKALKWESNPSVWKMLWREYLEMKGEIQCAYCPFHKYENANRTNYGRSWKSNRKFQAHNKHGIDSIRFKEEIIDDNNTFGF